MDVEAVLSGKYDDDAEGSEEPSPVAGLKDALGLDDSKAQRLYDVLCDIVAAEHGSGSKPSSFGTGPKKKLDIASVLKGR